VTSNRKKPANPPPPRFVAIRPLEGLNKSITSFVCESFPRSFPAAPVHFPVHEARTIITLILQVTSIWFPLLTPLLGMPTDSKRPVKRFHSPIEQGTVQKSRATLQPEGWTPQVKLQPTLFCDCPWAVTTFCLKTATLISQSYLQIHMKNTAGYFFKGELTLTET